VFEGEEEEEDWENRRVWRKMEKGGKKIEILKGRVIR
jgi:hypothetical protein